MTKCDWPFPIELTEKILFNLDGRSLAKASSVCKTWKNAFLNLSSVYNIWETCCRREISSEILIDLIEKLFPSFPVSKRGTVNWFVVYKCWCVWRKIESWDMKSKTLVEAYDSQIRCLKVSGDWLIYGTVHEGTIVAYNSELQISIPLFRGHGVIDIDLFNTVQFSYDANKILPHDGVSVLFSDHSIVRYSLDEMEEVCRMRNNDFMNLKVLLEWILAVKSNFSLKMDSIGLSFDKNDGWMKCITKKQKVRVSLVGEVILLQKDHNFCNSEIFVEGVEEITHWSQLSYSVSFGIAYKMFHVLFVVIDDKMKAYLPPDQLFTVKCAFMHCNMLFLGNNRGSVFVYRLKAKEDLLKFNFAKYVCKYDISNSVITAIDVQYSLKDCNHEIPYLVVSTANSIHKIDFFNQ